jgi:pimeloyl-ACP methyl ester carboxylesterase
LSGRDAFAMVKPIVVIGLAFGVFQLAKLLPSPCKELFLICICAGVLTGHTLMQQASSERGPGPAPPPGWHMRTKATNDTSNTIERDGSVNCEVLVLAAADGVKSSLGIVIVPGNPGIPQLYCAFGEELRGALQSAGRQSTTIYIVGFPNFVTGAAAASAREKLDVSSIQVEADAMAATLAELHTEHSERGVVVIGHSVGAWVATQALLHGACPLSDVPLLVLAMPYLEFSPMGRQARYRTLFAQPFFEGLIRFLAVCAISLPGSVQNLIARRLHKEQPEIILRTFLQQPHHMIAMPLLARSAFTRLDPAWTEGAGLEEFRPLFETTGRPPVLALHTRGDPWVPSLHQERLKTLFAEVDEMVSVGDDSAKIEHSFMVRVQDARTVASIIAAHIVTRTRS